MLTFYDLERSKIAAYRSYYDCREAVGTEVSFVSACLWAREYAMKVAVFDDTLIKVYFRRDGSVWGYCMPAGKNPRGAVEAIFEDARERGQRAQFGYLSQKERELLEVFYPGRFIFTRSPATQDYIYLTADLAGLAGKKYHAKRNHIAKFFRAYPNAEVREITSGNAGDVMTVVRRWCAERKIDADAYAETAVIRDALDDFDTFGLRGILLYIETEPVAFALGSELSPVCFDIHFEKALTACEGSYAVINNEFAKRLTDYTYLNREEDMGLEGLRKAKLSYHPVMIYDRYDGAAQW